MASTFTPNIQLEEPARGDDVGVWDTPVNNNMTLIDKVVGGVTTISLNNSPVVLSAAQYQSREIIFNSTLTGNVAITFPTSFTKDYYIFNVCTGSSAFVVTLQTTVAGGQVIACPPGEGVSIYNFGTSIVFLNLGRVGSYMDFGGSSVPLWVSNCSIPPYLNCDGSTFSATTYPALATILGSTTLPDSRGRGRFSLNQGVTRVSAAGSGIDGNTRSAAGGNELQQSHTHTANITDPGHTHPTSNGVQDSLTQGGGPAVAFLRFNVGGGLTFLANAFTGITSSNALTGGGNSQNMPPAYMGGITMIRAA